MYSHLAASIQGSLAVAPMFLHDNAHSHAVINVICLPLLVFSLMERALRLAIGVGQYRRLFWRVASGQSGACSGR
jgi:hypothetical protein